MIATKYDTTSLGKFNIPLYQVALSTPGSAHGMNAVLVGDNPLNAKDWQYIEPQYGESNLTNPLRNLGENWNPPFESIIDIRKFMDITKDAQNNLFVPVESIVKFKIDNNGQPNLYGNYNPNLLLTKPTVAVEGDNNLNAPENYSLEQNYPNPFNPNTKIPYNIDRQAEISLDLYDIKGRHIKNLEKGVKEPGAYIEKFNGSNLPSGNYIISLKTSDGYNQSRKISLVK